MTRDDLDGVLAIEEATFSPPWSRASYESELESPVACYLVLEDGEILGYAGMWMILDEGISRRSPSRRNSAATAMENYSYTQS